MANEKYNIILSAGHSSEHDGYINTELAKKLSEHEQAEDVVNSLYNMDRSTRYFIAPDSDLASKVTYINTKASIYKCIALEVHFNSSVEHNGASGTEVLVYPGSIIGKKLGNCVMCAISKYLPFKHRGLKERNDLYFLRKTKVPAIIIEVLFLDNMRDATYLLHERAHEIIARGIKEGIDQFISNCTK